MRPIKKILVAMAVLLVFEGTAQTEIGLRGGINLATVTEVQNELDPNLNPKNIIGLNFAVFSELNVTDMFALQPEINFLQKGTKVNTKDMADISDVNIKMIVNYLEVPILAKLRFGSEKLKGSAFLGPSVGYALGGKATFTQHGTEFTDKIVFDKDINDDGLKDQRWDFSAIIGAGGALAAGPGSVILDVRYGWDFTDFTRFKDAKPTGYKESYNRGLGISVGYQIPISKT